MSAAPVLDERLVFDPVFRQRRGRRPVASAALVAGPGTATAPVLDERLDFEPVCDGRDCSSPAVWSGRLRRGHGGLYLGCDPCVQQTTAALAYGWSCRSCHCVAVPVWRPL